MDKENLSKLNAELEVRVEEFVRSNELLKDKMRLYSGDSGIDTADLERALTLGKYKAKERAARNGSTVVDISIPLPSFKPVSLPSPCSFVF